jgi:hypothetical protein
MATLRSRDTPQTAALSRYHRWTDHFTLTHYYLEETSDLAATIPSVLPRKTRGLPRINQAPHSSMLMSGNHLHLQ